MNNATNSSAAITREIGKVKKTAGTLRERVQRTGIMIMVHAINHGDWTKANDLVNALGDGVNGKALVSWFSDNLGLMVDPDSKQFNGWSGKEYAVNHLDAAKKVKWHDHKKQSAFEGWNLETELAKLLKKAEQMQGNYNEAMQEGDTSKASKIVVNFDVMEKLRAAKAA
jgi:hypothetical protein